MSVKDCLREIFDAVSDCDAPCYAPDVEAAIRQSRGEPS